MNPDGHPVGIKRPIWKILELFTSPFILRPTNFRHCIVAINDSSKKSQSATGPVTPTTLSLREGFPATRILPGERCFSPSRQIEPTTKARALRTKL
jgi:hypothetical protein